MKYIAIIAVLIAIITGTMYFKAKQATSNPSIETLSEPVDIDKAIQSGGITLD
jgi:hypothetical protein